MAIQLPPRQRPKPIPRATVASLSGSKEFRDWYDELRVFSKEPQVEFLYNAIVAYASSLGFPKPAPGR